MYDGAENQQQFVTFVLPSSGIILAIYNTLYGLGQIGQMSERTNVWKNNGNFGLQTLSVVISLSIYYVHLRGFCWALLQCCYKHVAQKNRFNYLFFTTSEFLNFYNKILKHNISVLLINWDYSRILIQGSQYLHHNVKISSRQSNHI